MKPIRVLHVFASLDRGGAEAMIMNIYRQIDREKVQFDFLVNDTKPEYAFEAEAKSLGANIYRLPRYNFINALTYLKKCRKLFKTHGHGNWQIVHGHYKAAGYLYFPVAKQLNMTTISHAHIAGTQRTFKSYFRKPFRKLTNDQSEHLFTCSTEAAQYTYGSKASKAILIENAVDTHKFQFDPVLREEKRAALGLQDKTLYAHVGRFSEQKNHMFLIDIFKEITKLDPTAVLLLVGDGTLRKTVEAKVKTLALENQVIFTGIRSDVDALLSAFDVMLMPSLFEGLPVSVIEAQSTGLPCLISDTISPEVLVTPLAQNAALTDSSETWAKKAISMVSQNRSVEAAALVKSAGYDIRNTAEKITQLYLDMARKSE